MGTLKPGDVILAINGQSLESCNLREAAQMLRNAGDIVTLTISKESAEKPSTGRELGGGRGEGRGEERKRGRKGGES